MAREFGDQAARLKRLVQEKLWDADAQFYAPFGPTTAEQRHPQFSVVYRGHECQWNGPSWPYSTAVTLVALANLLNNYQQDTVTKADYVETLNRPRRGIAQYRLAAGTDRHAERGAAAGRNGFVEQP